MSHTLTTHHTCPCAECWCGGSEVVCITTWPEEGEGMGKEWEGGGGVTGRQRTECVPPSRR
eukprot:scaffold1084_cov114-Isochrysis_galbana.AAC.6